MIFAHVDVNSFYASCEKIFRPDLKYFPVIVLSNNDGCVVARSSEAKELGIKMGTPFFKISPSFIAAKKIQVFSSNYALYADMSARVMDTLNSLMPSIEIYSIDEAFCDVTSLDKIANLMSIGKITRETVLMYTHLTVGVGIAQTKTLAKLANYAAKKWVKTGGVVDLTDMDRQKKLMKITPVNEVWGIGKAISEQLIRRGIKTALELSKMNRNIARNEFSITLEKTIMELCGESCIDLEEIPSNRKQIVCSRSFGVKLSDYTLMNEAISEHVVRAAEKLRAQKMYCKHITVFIKTSPFDNKINYNPQESKKISPTSDTRELLAYACALLKEMWLDGINYQKAGVILNDFCSAREREFDLFTDMDHEIKKEKLMNTVDYINKKHGKFIYFGSQGANKKWQMKQDYLSKSYTTNISDIPVAKF